MAFKKVKREDSFAYWFIENFGQEEFDKVVNVEKTKKQNNIDVWAITKRSGKLIWFNCTNKNYHEYCLSADKYYKGYRCKYCARTKHVHPLDSFGQYIKDKLNVEDVNIIWSDKNKISPFKYTIGTEKKVWLKCLNGIHDDSLRQVKNAVASELICPYCSENYNVSKLQTKVHSYISEKFKNVNIENCCTIIPINPKTKHPMPFDNEIVDLKLIIEVHGRQHYELIGKNSKWLNGLTPSEYLHQRKLKDRYKKIYAISNGYEYLEIPYWCDDKEESWKQLIDDKIKAIMRGTTTETD